MNLKPPEPRYNVHPTKPNFEPPQKCRTSNQTSNLITIFKKKILKNFFCSIFSGSPSSSSSSVPSSSSHNVVHEKSQENHQIAHAVQSHIVQGKKLIPEPGWMPLTGTPIGKSQLSGHHSTRHAQPRSINPALSFLQDTPVTPAHTSSTLTQQNLANAAIASSHIIKNYQQSSFHQQQKPTHKPVIIIPQTTTYDVLYHIPPTTAQPRNLGTYQAH